MTGLVLEPVVLPFNLKLVKLEVRSAERREKNLAPKREVRALMVVLNVNKIK